MIGVSDKVDNVEPNRELNCYNSYCKSIRGIKILPEQIVFIIRKVLENGTIETFSGNGQFGWSGDRGPAISGQLYFPQGVYVSSENEIFIADSGNSIIRKVVHGCIQTIVGNQERLFSGDNGLARNATLHCPNSIFVSDNNEIYIADSGNHRIRKILQNGNIVTIAGNGQEGYGGDNGPATSANLKFPYSVFVSEDKEVYITDRGNHRIRKILQNGNIVTIAGNGHEGYGGDNGPATSASLNWPTNVFVTSNNEIYIADSRNHRIRKVCQDGNIITIAGNGQKGYSGDSLLINVIHPHVGGSIYSTRRVKSMLKKHSRDLLFNTSIYAFIPLIERLSPLFCKHIVKNELLLSSMNSIQQELTQKLIDSLIYNFGSELKIKSDELLNVLLILGLFKNIEFIEVKRSLTNQFIQSLTIENLSFEWELIEKYLSLCRNEFGLENYILEHLNNYCIEFAAIQMKNPGGVNYFPTLPIIVKNSAAILSKQSLSEPNPIILHETLEIESKYIDSLFNDKKTSDLKIEISQDTFLYCHKTILCTSSALFNAMFNSGSTFSDLNENIFIPDPEDDLELLEILIMTCYGIPVEYVPYEKLVIFLDMAMKHEMEYLIQYCKNELNMSVENYFDIALACESYFDLPYFDSFFKHLLRFGIENRKQLFNSYESISKLPTKLAHAIIFKLSQEF